LSASKKNSLQAKPGEAFPSKMNGEKSEKKKEDGGITTGKKHLEQVLQFKNEENCAEDDNEQAGRRCQP
jgi:hypothetical protein